MLGARAPWRGRLAPVTAPVAAVRHLGVLGWVFDSVKVVGGGARRAALPLDVNIRLSLDFPQAHYCRLNRTPKSALAVPRLAKILSMLFAFPVLFIYFIFTYHLLCRWHCLLCMFVFIFLPILLPNNFPSLWSNSSPPHFFEPFFPKTTSFRAEILLGP